ncbi:MAG: phosphatidylglycerol:prolipoprotein diacylglycerol transferase, partial [Microgenomates group bacterium Gr01-1014_93]
LFIGGVTGGILSLYFFSKRLNLNFWQAADAGAVGFLGAAIFGNIGCFLGGCSIGIPSNAFFAIPVVGVLDKRFPVQLLEASILGLILIKFWKSAIHFHFNGKIFSLCLIFVGLIRFFLEFFREKENVLNYFLYVTIFLAGIFIFYFKSKRNIVIDLKSLSKNIADFITKPEDRKIALKKLTKSWYNQRVSFSWKIKGVKTFLRRVNVKPTPKNF